MEGDLEQNPGVGDEAMQEVALGTAAAEFSISFFFFFHQNATVTAHSSLF